MRATKIIENIVIGMKMLRRPSVRYCANNGLLPEVLTETLTEEVRDFFFLPRSPHKTQLNQDIFALLINRFARGYFLEIGANDGFTISNTVYLEEHFRWDGLLVEANPEYEPRLKERKAKSVIAAIAEREGEHEFRSAGLYGGLSLTLNETHTSKWKDAKQIRVRGVKLERVLLENEAPELINFVSIDVEGAELEVVSQMCNLATHKIVCGCIEHNNRAAEYKKIENLLRSAGYQIVWEHQTGHDIFFVQPGLVSASV